MQAAVMRAPMMAQMAYTQQESTVPARMENEKMRDRSPLRGFSPFAVRCDTGDELSNGDPPDLMLWGEE